MFFVEIGLIQNKYCDAGWIHGFSGGEKTITPVREMRRNCSCSHSLDIWGRSYGGSVSTKSKELSLYCGSSSKLFPMIIFLLQPFSPLPLYIYDRKNRPTWNPHTGLFLPLLAFTSFPSWCHQHDSCKLPICVRRVYTRALLSEPALSHNIWGAGFYERCVPALFRNVHNAVYSWSTSSNSFSISIIWLWTNSVNVSRASRTDSRACFA